jgi:hypothetical protein
MAFRSPERGHAVLVSVIVVLVITVLAVGAIRFASREVSGALAARKEAGITTCADAARHMLMSQWKLLGETSGLALPPLNQTLEPLTPTVLRGGHYGDVNVSSVQIVKLNDLTTGARVTADDLTNRIGEAVSNYRVVVHCTQGRGADARELEVEFGVNYGL